MSLERAHFILYVRDQAASREFYRRALDVEPTLDVPGMTELDLGGCVLGLMPERGVTRLLGDAVDPSRANGAPRAEVYLVVDDPAAYVARAVGAGARVVSELAPRDWGACVAYVLDPDGHVVAFACPIG